jgi:molybdate transport system substrate-binding protein
MLRVRGALSKGKSGQTPIIPPYHLKHLNPMKRTQNVVIALLAVISSLAHADNIRVLAAGAAKAAVERIAPEFTRQTGHTLSATFDTVGAQRDRVLNGAPGGVADVVILSKAAITQLRNAARLTQNSAHDIGLVSVSLAVPQGAPVPDISSPEALKQTLLAAPSIAYADPARGATAGTHFAKVVDTLGLGSILQTRTTVLPFGVEVIKDVSHGKYALGVSQSSEILQHPGITMVGPLPAPLGLSTGYAAAQTSQQAAASMLITYLTSETALNHFRATGFLAE